MVDVDRRMTSLATPAQAAALRRLSARAAASPFVSPARECVSSFAPLTDRILGHLRQSGVSIEQGLLEPELARAEAEFGFVFPPDLRAVLSAGLPSGPGFPDWRHHGYFSHLMHIPMAALSLQIARSHLWPQHWGPRPHDSDKALRVARSALKRAPPLVPVFGHCYIPCRPCLVGNPIFFVDETRVYCCALDLSDFFGTKRALLDSGLPEIPTGFRKVRSMSEGSMPGFSKRSLDRTRVPRWVDFWSHVAIDCRRRNSVASSCGSLTAGLLGTPRWVEKYVESMGSVLREGGWSETDVKEMTYVSPSGLFNDDSMELELLDNQTVLNALVIKADRLCDVLRSAGWTSEEVTDAFGFTLRRSENDELVLPQQVK